MRRFPLLVPLLAAAALLHAVNAFGWSFAACGDSRNDAKGILPRIMAEVERSRMAFLMHTGDLEDGGGKRHWTDFKARTKGFSKPLYLVIGNHEIRDGGTAEGFARFFGLSGTSYSFDHEDAHIAIVDNARGRFADGALDWLDRDLAAHPKRAGGIRHLIVAMHIPPRTDNLFPHGTSGGYGDESDRLYRLLKRHGVSLVLCSHEHMHFVEDWNGIRVIVSGGAGAPMYPFQPYGYYEIDLSGTTPREIFHPVEP